MRAAVLSNAITTAALAGGGGRGHGGCRGSGGRGGRKGRGGQGAGEEEVPQGQLRGESQIEEVQQGKGRGSKGGRRVRGQDVCGEGSGVGQGETERNNDKVEEWFKFSSIVLIYFLLQTTRLCIQDEGTQKPWMTQRQVTIERCMSVSDGDMMTPRFR